MSWYDESFEFRYPIAIENTGATANYDLSVVFPSQWDTFWESIGSNGYDVIPVSPSGNLIPFKRLGFNYANRALTLQMDSFELTTVSVNLIYIYFKKASASDQATAVTISTPKDGFIWLGKPTNMIVGPSTFTGSASTTTESFVMNTTTNAYMWFSVQNILSNRFAPYNDRMNYEEIQYCKVSVLNNSGATVPGMIDQNKTRFIPGFIGVFVQGSGGVDNNNYQVRLTIQTVQGAQTFALTSTLSIRNKLPA